MAELVAQVLVLISLTLDVEYIKVLVKCSRSSRCKITSDQTLALLKKPHLRCGTQ